MIFPSFIVLERPSGEGGWGGGQQTSSTIPIDRAEEMEAPKDPMAHDCRFIMVFLQVKRLRCLPISRQVSNGPLYHPSHLLATHV